MIQIKHWTTQPITDNTLNTLINEFDKYKIDMTDKKWNGYVDVSRKNV